MLNLLDFVLDHCSKLLVTILATVQVWCYFAFVFFFFQFPTSGLWFGAVRIYDQHKCPRLLGGLLRDISFARLLFSPCCPYSVILVCLGLLLNQLTGQLLRIRVLQIQLITQGPEDFEE